MTFDQRVTAGKPYVVGFVAGLIAAPIIAFSAGWVSTSGARAEAVENARVETLVDICAANVERIVSTRNTDLASLRGYENRETREELIAAALVDVEVPEALTRKVSSACNRTLA